MNSAIDISKSVTQGSPQQTVVLIDDDSLTTNVYQMLLEQEGYRVLTAENGLEGLALLKREKSIPELIFVDCSMPQMDGEAFLIKLREDLPEVLEKSKVVGFTCFDSQSAIFKKIKPLAYDCREKPYDIDAILSLVHFYLDPNPASNPSLKQASGI